MPRRYEPDPELPIATIAELAYTAGIVDGEGSVALTRWKNSFLPFVQVTNTDRRIIDWLQERFGGSVYIFTRNSPIHKPRFNLRWVGKHSTALLIVLLPYLVLKRQQAELCLRYYSEGRNFHDGNNRLPEFEYERRKQLHAALKALNKRGLTDSI
jgi:hypothetical protein